jgi:hypothetical protein
VIDAESAKESGGKEMFAKRFARSLALTAFALAMGGTALPVTANADEWRAGGVAAGGWSPGLHPHPYPYAFNRGDAASAAAGAAAGVVAGSVISNALTNPAPQPTSPPSSVTIVPPQPQVANPSVPEPNFPITAGVYPPEWHSYCASKYPNYDPQTGTYVSEDGYRQYCQ